MRNSEKAIMAVVLTSVVTLGLGNALAANDGRGFVAGHYELELDRALSGHVSDVAGGSIVGSVIFEKLGPDRVIKKHISAIRYEDITVHAGTAMSTGFYRWIADTMSNTVGRKNGAVIALSPDNKEISQISFSNAFLSGIEFPALDAASREAAKLSVTLSPNMVRLIRTANQSKAIASHETIAKQKKWLTSSFRLKIDGLDAATSSVSKIDPITVKVKTVSQDLAADKSYQAAQTALEYSDLVITLPESRADAFYKWHEDFVIKSNNGDDKEKSGTLEFLAPNLQEVIFTLNLKHLGISSIETEKQDSADAQRNVRVRMYIENATFSVNNAAQF